METWSSSSPLMNGEPWQMSRATAPCAASMTLASASGAGVGGSVQLTRHVDQFDVEFGELSEATDLLFSTEAVPGWPAAGNDYPPG